MPLYDSSDEETVAAKQQASGLSRKLASLRLARTLREKQQRKALGASLLSSSRRRLADKSVKAATALKRERDLRRVREKVTRQARQSAFVDGEKVKVGVAEQSGGKKRKGTGNHRQPVRKKPSILDQDFLAKAITEDDINRVSRDDACASTIKNLKVSVSLTACTKKLMRLLRIFFVMCRMKHK